METQDELLLQKVQFIQETKQTFRCKHNNFIVTNPGISMNILICLVTENKKLGMVKLRHDFKIPTIQ